MNHADKAVSILSGDAVGAAADGAWATAVAAEAQVHATLAVAYQLEQLVRVTQSHHFAAGSL